MKTRIFRVIAVMLLSFFTINSALAQQPEKSARKQEKQARREREKAQDQDRQRETRPPARRIERNQREPERNRRQEPARAREDRGRQDTDRIEHRRQPRIEAERRHDHGRWTRDRHVYRRPSLGYYYPRHGRAYHRHYYPFRYRVPVIIFIARIPLIILNHRDYRGCEIGTQRIVNLSGHRAQITINGCVYVFHNGREFLYPGECVSVDVPINRDYDLDANIFVDNDWYDADLRLGRVGDLIIMPPVPD